MGLKTPKPKIAKVLVAPNGMVAVFDRDGKQIGELQTPLLLLWAQMATRRHYDVDGLEIEIVGQRNVKLFKTKHGFNFEEVS